MRARWLFLLVSPLCACRDLEPFPLPNASATWDGSYLTLDPGEGATTAPPNAYTALRLDNLGNSATTVLLTAGGAPPVIVDLPPGTNTPAFYIDDFSPSNLNVFNQDGSAVGVQLLGIGIDGIVPAPLVLGVAHELLPGTFAQAVSHPNLMNLSLSTSTNALTTFIVFGGTTPGADPTTRAVVIQLNAGAVSGPASGGLFANSLPQPTGSSLDPAPGVVYASTTAATYELLYNWGASTILITNVSGITAGGASVTLASLG